jgi:oligopeptide/dipeptide ABC transporter ATP-binding protein
MDERATPLLEARDLTVRFPVRSGLLGRARQEVHAVDAVSLTIAPGETLGLVGESGCGKTTLARALLRLVEPTSGTIRFEGVDVRALDGAKLRALRRRMQIVFQDPWSSLNPRMTIGAIIGEGLIVHRIAKGRELERRVAELLQFVGLPPDAASRYPHEFSGGQRQRIGIARALAVGPSLVVCDEAVASLDVSVQAQVLNLLIDLRERHRLAYLFISHDLAIVRHLSRRVAVMYLGEIVETGSAEEVLARPRHPYTQALLAAVPSVEPGQARARLVLHGEPPSPVDPPQGCRFHPRCPFAKAECRAAPPPAREFEPGHVVRCIL